MSLIQVAPDIWLPDRSLKFGAATSDRIDLGAHAITDDLQPATCVALCYFTTTPADGNIVYFKGLTGGNGRMSCLFFNNGGITLAVSRRGTTTNLFAQGLLTNLRAWGLYKWVWLAFQCDTTTDANNKVWCGDFNQPFMEPSAYVVQTKGSGTISSYAGQTAWWANNSALVNSLPAGSRISIGWVWNRLLAPNELEFIRTTGTPRAGSLLCTLLGDNGIGAQADVTGNGSTGTVTGATQESGPAQAYMQQPSRNFFAVPLGMMEWLRQRKLEVRRAA